MQSESSASYTAWQDAEQRAAAAESKLFAKVLSEDTGHLPTRDEVEAVRCSREAANELLDAMVAEMGERADSLRYARYPAAPAVPYEPIANRDLTKR